MFIATCSAGVSCSVSRKGGAHLRAEREGAGGRKCRKAERKRLPANLSSSLTSCRNLDVLNILLQFVWKVSGKVWTFADENFCHESAKLGGLVLLHGNYVNALSSKGYLVSVERSGNTCGFAEKFLLLLYLFAVFKSRLEKDYYYIVFLAD